jgi:hypothetical protein
VRYRMQIVINIDEKIYKRILPYKDVPVISNLCNDYPEITYAIANGVPLPKSHGRLIDADAINLKDISPVDGFSVYGATAEDIDLTPTIIEADRSEEDG